MKKYLNKNGELGCSTIILALILSIFISSLFPSNPLIPIIGFVILIIAIPLFKDFLPQFLSEIELNNTNSQINERFKSIESEFGEDVSGAFFMSDISIIEMRELKSKYGSLDVHEILFLEELNDEESDFLLLLKGHSIDEVSELKKTHQKEIKKSKLRLLKQKIRQKSDEIYDTMPTSNKREPISEDVRMFVWRRDGGKCTRCGSQENLHFDHIIPHSKGGSNTERNLQLLCESCNLTKSDKI